MATSVMYEIPLTTFVWYVKHAALRGFAVMLRSSTSDRSSGGLLAGRVFHGIAFLYKFPPWVSQVYSMYSMLPSELMSPNSLRTVAVDPLSTAAGTIPLEKPPATMTGTPLACGLLNAAVI